MSNNLGPILNGHDFGDAVKQFRELDAQLGVVPEAARHEIYTAQDHLLERAHEISWTSLRQVTDHAGDLVAAAASVPKKVLNQFLSQETAPTVHLYRNVLLATVLVGPRRTFGKDDPGTLAARFPTLRPRTAERCRPHTADEIVLLRIWNLIQSDVGGKLAHKSAAVYAQCDAGLTPTETAMVSVRNVTLIPGLGKIDAPGLNSGVAKRTLPPRGRQRLHPVGLLEPGSRGPRRSSDLSAEGGQVQPHLCRRQR
jgi:hypothetical protein